MSDASQIRIAIVGTGIAGNVAAYKLASKYETTVFEADSRIGGHTNTVDVGESGPTIPIDTGFIVFNDRTYPHFIRLLDEIGQESQPSVMSFSVQSSRDGIEYNGASLNALFAQRRNLLRPSFLRMIRDILRFNEEAPFFSAHYNDSVTLGEYLRENDYSRQFAEHYLVPMAAAIWSAEPVSVYDMPMGFLVRFFANHGLLQLRDRPEWRVIKGGSREYVSKLTAGHKDRIRLNSPVETLRRDNDGVQIYTRDGGWEGFDYVFLACHSDQALAMLDDATETEKEILGDIPYQENEAILHSDDSLMPKRRKAWAAWNYHLPKDPQNHVAVTYNMNILQSLETTTQYLVTLNNDEAIDPDRIISRIRYEHPIFSLAGVSAQARQSEINSDRSFFCGAYWRNGFHEDGVVSALNALQHFEKRLSNAELHLRRAS